MNLLIKNISCYLYVITIIISSISSPPPTIVWTGNTNFDWNTASNWNPSTVPTSSDDVEIPTGLSNYPIINSLATNTVKKITVDGSLTINAGGNLSSTGDVITNTGGAINLTGGSLSTLKSFDVKGGDVTTSGGTISCKDYKGSGTMAMSGGLFQVSHDFKPSIPSNFSAIAGTVQFTGNAGPKGFDVSGTYSFWNVLVDVSDPNFNTNNTNIISISNNLTLYAAIELPTNDASTANTLTLASTNQISGTWGSSTSGSTNTNNTYFIGDGFITISTILPVQLTEFKGEIDNGNIKLFWRTASELNHERFVVERSYNGNVFDPICNIKCHCNSDICKSYSYTDFNPIIGINYYRLQQIDMDGTHCFSSIIAIKKDQESKTYISYPNPVRDILNIELLNRDTNEDHKRAVISLHNIHGVLIKQKECFGESFYIEVRDIPSGVYYLTIENKFNQIIDRIVID